MYCSRLIFAQYNYIIYRLEVMFQNTDSNSYNAIIFNVKYNQNETLNLC